MVYRLSAALALACLLWAAPAWARDVELFHDFSVGVQGTIKNLEHYSAGAQAFTYHGPGDSAWIMGHVGLGLDLGYAHPGEGVHRLDLTPMGELLVFWVFLQAGLGPSFDLQDIGDSSLHIVLSPGVMIPLHDEYQGLAVILGGRFDFYVVGQTRIVPAAMLRVSFYIPES